LFFEDDEIVNGRSISEFTSVSSINPEGNVTVAFSTEKLNVNKDIIIKYIDSLPIEEGNSLDNLYFDKDGNNWCDGIKTMDQLIMLALACQLVSVSTIETKERGKESTIIVNRTRENDSLKVIGTNPEVLPYVKDNQLSKGYTEEAKN